MKNITIRNGLILAGLSNIFGVLIFSRIFTNEVINAYDPLVMSNFGLLMIVVWGVAYLSVANSFHDVKWLMAVFATEKLIYSLVWIDWFFKNDIRAVFNRDIFAGVFYSIYGINDLIFMVFFIIAVFSIADRK